MTIHRTLESIHCITNRFYFIIKPFYCIYRANSLHYILNKFIASSLHIRPIHLFSALWRKFLTVFSQFTAYWSQCCALISQDHPFNQIHHIIGPIRNITRPIHRCIWINEWSVLSSRFIVALRQWSVLFSRFIVALRQWSVLFSQFTTLSYFTVVPTALLLPSSASSSRFPAEVFLFINYYITCHNWTPLNVRPNNAWLCIIKPCIHT